MTHDPQIFGLLASPVLKTPVETENKDVRKIIINFGTWLTLFRKEINMLDVF